MDLVYKLDLHGQKKSNSLQTQKTICERNKKLINMCKCNDLGIVAKKIFGINSKKSRKLIIQMCERDFSFHLLFLYYLRISFKIDSSKVFQLADNFLERWRYGYFNEKQYMNLLIPKSFEFLADLYTEKRISNWINMCFDDEWFDEMNWLPHVLRDLKRIRKYPDLIQELKYLDRKRLPKSFRDFHNECSMVFSYLDIADFDLKQKEHILKLDGQIISDYRIIIPKTKHDLINLGNKFRFCIGTEDHYGLNIRNGKYSFIALFKENKPVSGLLIDDKRIVESYDYANKVTALEVRNLMREYLFGTKEILLNPNSIFAKALKYDKKKKILTIITQKGKNLKYQGVESELVSKFENSHSHGRFYRDYIKGQYTYLKSS